MLSTTRVSDRPIRILVVSKSFRQGFGGTPESVLLLAQNLALAGVACDVVSDEGFFRDVHRAGSLGPMGQTGAQHDTIAMANYAGLFIAGPWIFRAARFAWRARRHAIPVSYAPKGGLGRADFGHLRDIKKIPYLLTVELFILALARRIVFSSTVEQQNCVLPQFLRRKKQIILPEPFSPTPLCNTVAKPAQGPVVIGYMALFRPLKGLREFVEAAILLDRQPGRPDFRLRIAGVPRPGAARYFADVHALASQNLVGRVEWLGRINGDEERSNFYESLDVFVCPSKSESFGLTPLEALWHGVPSAMGPEIGIRDYLPADVPIAVFAKVEPGEIASTLRESIEQREARTAAARQWRGKAVPGLAGVGLAMKFRDALVSEMRKGEDRKA